MTGAGVETESDTESDAEAGSVLPSSVALVLFCALLSALPLGFWLGAAVAELEAGARWHRCEGGAGVG